jgi:PAS domain S-box-containing protein
MLKKLIATLQKTKWLVLGIVVLLSAATIIIENQRNSDGTVSLTIEERAWLNAHPVIRLAPDPDFPPTEFFDANGKYIGIAADYVALMQKRLGVRFQVVKLRDWSEVLIKARRREIDVLAAVTKTPDRSEYLLFTKPYLEFPAVIITQDSFKGPLNLRNMAGKKLSVKAGYGARYYVVTNYPNVQVDVVPDIHTGLRKVSFGAREALLENLLTASYYMEKEVITNLRIAGEAEYMYRMAFAVRSDWPMLQKILNKGLDQVSSNEREVIYNKWVPLNSQFLLVNKRITPPILMAAGLLLLLVVLVFLWNRSLSRQVDRRTAELNEELAERKRIEAALRESEEKFRVLAETSPAAIFLYQGENLVYINPSVTRLTGFSEQECLAMKFWDWVDTDYQWEVKSYGLKRQMGASVPEQYETQFLTRDGTKKWMLLSAGRIQYRGAPAGIASVFDITDRKRMEEDLRRANEELERRVTERTAELAASMDALHFTQFAVDRSADQAFWLQEKGRIFYVNNSACRSLGYTREQLVGMLVTDIDPDYDFSRHSETWHILRNEGAITFESRHRSKSGRTYPVEVRANFVAFDGKEYNCCFVTDISERKQTEDKLRKSEANLRTVAAALQKKQGLLRTLFNSIPDLIFYKDTEGVYLGCNRAFENFTGKAEKDMLGCTDFELFSFEIALSFRKRDLAMLSQGTARCNEEWVDYPDGRRVLLETLKTPYRNPDGTLLGLIGISRDITQRKIAEEALRTANDELDLRVRERTEQLTSLAAELSRAEEDERRRIASELHDQVAQTLALSKIKLNSLVLSEQFGEGGKVLREIMGHLTTSIEEIRSLTFQLSPPILHEVGIDAALEWLSEEFQEKYCLRIRFRTDGRKKPLEKEIRGAIYQMSRELLVNIVKHAQAKNVLVETTAFSHQVKVCISDDGVGFNSSDALRFGNKNNSFGLLNIHHRMNHLGGQLVIESDYDRGTRATLIIPFGIDEKTPQGSYNDN